MPESYGEAILRAQRDILKSDPLAILMGEGVCDEKGIFGTTKGLKEEFPGQVFEQPVSEAGATGAMIGAALNGLHPILTHQRMDFSLYSADQLINNAAKWFSMFGGARSVPLTIRMTIGRGWGQGNQHSQNLAPLYASIPGLKVFMPSDSETAYHLLRAAHDDPNPVLFIEHKWLYNCKDIVPEERGDQVTLVASGYMFHEAKAWASRVTGVDLINLTKLNPIDYTRIIESVEKTRGLIVMEDAWDSGAIGNKIIARVARAGIELKGPPMLQALPDFYCPSNPALAKHYYPEWIEKEKHDLDPFTQQFTGAI
jgi:acetoin:2,6-dichlorophenolindophenol oxidoreductase subunit beta